MKIAIAGATGRIGHYIVEELKKRDKILLQYAI